jgi:hypothetical protein
LSLKNPFCLSFPSPTNFFGRSYPVMSGHLLHILFFSRWHKKRWAASTGPKAGHTDLLPSLVGRSNQ